MAKIQPLGVFLDADDAVNRLAAHAALLLRLRETAPLALPAPLGRSFTIASFRQGKVVIFAENNAIAAKLRLFEPRLIDLWARQGLQVNAIRVDVQPAARQSDTAAKRAILSETAERALTSLGERLPDGSPLQEAVRSLAHRGRKPGAGGD